MVKGCSTQLVRVPEKAKILENIFLEKNARIGYWRNFGKTIRQKICILKNPSDQRLIGHESMKFHVKTRTL